MAGSADVFIYNVGLVSVGIAIALNQCYGPSLYPGAGVWLSTLLARRAEWAEYNTVVGEWERQRYLRLW